jgi:DNA-binding LytR/AlgR family response regulator
MRIALVDDDKKVTDQMSMFLNRYSTETGLSFAVYPFHDSLEFLNKYCHNFDLIFLDIQMPGLDGMSLAEKIREKQDTTPIVFLTDYSQFAIKGYTVNAIDYILKPLTYEALKLKMVRILRDIKTTSDSNLVFTCKGKVYTFDSSDITYFSVNGHFITIHTDTTTVSFRGKLGDIEERVSGLGFSLCNKCYLVNLSHVDNMKGYFVKVGKDVLKVSHPRKKYFKHDLIQYLTGDK